MAEERDKILNRGGGNLPPTAVELLMARRQRLGGGGGMGITETERGALEDLKRAVHGLAQGVTDLKAGLIDEETVARIATDVMHGPRLVQQRRNGPMPFEMDGKDGFAVLTGPGSVFDVGAPDCKRLAQRGRDGVYELHSSYPGKVAAAIGGSVEVVRQRQAATDTLVIASAYLDKEPAELAYYRETFEPLVQAMDSGTAAEGLEYIPRELSGQLIERVNLELLVGALFPLVEMPSQPFDIPGVSVSRQRTGSHAEQTADTGQTKFKKRTAGTRKITLSAVKLAIEVLTSKELEEDSIIAVIPMIEEEIVDWLAADWEDVLINGDTTATHQDSDVTDSDDPRKTTAGLRKLTPTAAKQDASNAVLTSAMLRSARAKMGRYGTRADQLAHIVGMKSYVNLLGDSNVVTLDKYGPQATILTGELGKVDGVPIVITEYVRDDLNATGVYDGVTTNRSLALTVNRRGFLQGQRRGITVQVLRELYAESDQDAVVASFRRAFAARYPSTDPAVSQTYNVA